MFYLSFHYPLRLIFHNDSSSHRSSCLRINQDLSLSSKIHHISTRLITSHHNEIIHQKSSYLIMSYHGSSHHVTLRNLFHHVSLRLIAFYLDSSYFITTHFVSSLSTYHDSSLFVMYHHFIYNLCIVITHHVSYFPIMWSQQTLHCPSELPLCMTMTYDSSKLIIPEHKKS